MTTRTTIRSLRRHRPARHLRAHALAVMAVAVALLAPATASAVSMAPTPSLRGTASMQGQVLGRMDPVVGAATVTAFNADTGAAVRSTTADAEGNYRLGGLPAGNYKVRAVKAGWVTGWANCPTGTSKATATVFTLYAGQVLTQTWNPPNLYIDLWPESVIDGTVLGINNDPVNGWNGPLGEVKITVLDTATGAAVRSTTTDSQGNYRVGGLMGGDYTVRAAKAGWLTARAATTTAPWLPARADFTLYAEAVMQGQVLGWMDPLGGATVTAFNADTGAAVRSTTADMEGDYRLGGLPAGNYKVRAVKTGWLTGWANSNTATDKATATVFTLYAGQVLTQTWDPPNLYIDLSLESVIDGTVRGINNDPVNGWNGPLGAVKITVIDTDTGAAVRSTITDSQGNYRIGGLMVGDYTVRAAKVGWLTARAVATTAPWLSTHVDFTLYAEAVMQGQVLGRMDPVVGAATVTAFNADTGAAVRSTTADAEGNYRLGGLPAGNYKVRAVKAGWVTGWANCPTGTSKATATVFTLYAGQVLTQTWNPPNLYIDLWPVRPVS